MLRTTHQRSINLMLSDDDDDEEGEVNIIIFGQLNKLAKKDTLRSKMLLPSVVAVKDMAEEDPSDVVDESDHRPVLDGAVSIVSALSLSATKKSDVLSLATTDSTTDDCDFGSESLSSLTRTLRRSSSSSLVLVKTISCPIKSRVPSYMSA